MRIMKRLLACALLISVLASAAPKRPALPERYAKWLNQEVVYIITDEERKTFLTLTTDEERDKFEEDFWDIRNPSRGSGTNAYKEEHYNRIDYANAHFGRDSNTPGWMTDRGRTWILFGKPTSQHPFVGYSQIYPLDLWFYSNPTSTPSLPSFFYVMFFIPGDIGEYKFYRPYLDGPMQLVRGSQFNSNADVYKFLQPLGGDIAHASLSLIAGDPINTQNYQPDLSSDMLVSKIQNLANDHFNVQQLRTNRSLRALVTSKLFVSGKDLNLSTLVLTDGLKEKWLDYAVSVDDEQMGIRSDDGKFTVDFRYSLMTDSGNLILEDQTQRKYPGPPPFALAGRIPVVPGKYKLDVEIVNHKTGRSYHEQTSVNVPANAQETWLAGPLLADAVVSVARPSPAVPYQYFGAQFHPLIRSEFPARHTLRLLYQIYEPQPIDCEVEYVLANVGLREARAIVTEKVQAANFQNGLLLKSKSLDTTALPAGDYMLAIQLKSSQGPVLASLNQRLRIVNSSSDASLYFAAEPETLVRPGLVDYMRGLAAMAQGQNAPAQSYLERSLKLNPANSFGKQYLIHAYYHQHQYQAVDDLFGRSTIKDFSVSPDALAEIALSLWNSGNASQARGVLKTARGLFPEDSQLAEADKLLSRTKN
jgi:GWxTD domain-containing protein